MSTCNEIKESIKRELNIEQIEVVEKKRCARTDCHREQIYLRNGKIIKPIKIEHSRTYTTFYYYYLKRDIESADTVLEIYVSNSNRHYCTIKIKKFNLRSLRKALSIHSCHAVNDSLLRYIESNNIQLNI